MPAIGCPAYVPMAPKGAPSGAGLFFVSVQETMRGNSASSQVGISACCDLILTRYRMLAALGAGF